jgi:formylglycine-generating enzyme required for sulfatase activity
MAKNSHKSLDFGQHEGQSPVPPGRNHLLLIGIDRYQHVGKLNNAVRDAQAFGQLLQEKYQFDADRITTLYDAAATGEAIAQGFRKLIGQVKPGDNLIVYFSGHGHYDTVLEEGYWVPVEARFQAEREYISYDYLKKVIKAVKSQHTVFVVDSCYSGAVFVRGKDLQAERFERDPSRWMIASGRNEVVPDGVAGGNSPFAEHLLDLLDRYSLEGMRLSTLVERLTTNVTYNSRQTPIGRPMYEVGDKGGEFVFRPKRNQQADYQAARQAGTAQALQNFLQAYPDFPQKAEVEARIATLQDEEAWATAQKRHSIQAYRSYRQRFSQGKYRHEALDCIEQLEVDWDWGKAQMQDTISGYERFLDRYPDTTHRAAAEAAIERLLAATDSAPPPLVTAPASMSSVTDLIPLPHMIRIAGGSFQMGSNDSDADDDEQPVHSVTVASFYLAQTEVTFVQYDYFCEQTGRNKPEDEGWGRGNRPVINVSWEYAQAYIQWLNHQAGQSGWRLPTEAEWEYAAGGGASDRTKWAGTSSEGSLGSYAVYGGKGKTSPVQSKRSNSLGLYDMSGNVWEWCEDKWHDNYQGAPTNGSAWTSGSSSARVFRGGSWGSNAKYCRVADRNSSSPAYRNGYLGFRLARSS